MRMEERAEAAQCSILAACQPETAEFLLQGAFLQRFPAHTQLTREGDTADFLYVVLAGAVELYSLWRDRETTMVVLGPNDGVVDASVILDQPYPQSARTLEPSRILMLPSDSVRLALQQDGGFAATLAREIASSYSQLAQELKNQKLRTSLERLAHWLVQRDRDTGGTGRLTIPFEKKILAARLGMAPEVLSRSFAALAKIGLRVDGAQVTIRDPEALEDLAGAESQVSEKAV
jgi:CRP/FNR family transcriptional activator FtrB